MSGSRAMRKDACCVPVVWSEGSFIALVTVVYILVKNVSLDICREWERKEEVHDPCPRILSGMQYSWSFCWSSLSVLRKIE